MQKNLVRGEDVSDSVSAEVRGLQIKIADLYREISELEPRIDSRADALIQSVRLLESELVGLKIGQSRCSL